MLYVLSLPVLFSNNEPVIVNVFLPLYIAPPLVLLVDARLLVKLVLVIVAPLEAYIALPVEAVLIISLLSKVEFVIVISAAAYIAPPLPDLLLVPAVFEVKLEFTMSATPDLMAPPPVTAVFFSKTQFEMIFMDMSF